MLLTIIESLANPLRIIKIDVPTLSITDSLQYSCAPIF